MPRKAQDVSLSQLYSPKEQIEARLATVAFQKFGKD